MLLKREWFLMMVGTIVGVPGPVMLGPQIKKSVCVTQNLKQANSHGRVICVFVGVQTRLVRGPGVSHRPLQWKLALHSGVRNHH